MTPLVVPAPDRLLHGRPHQHAPDAAPSEPGEDRHLFQVRVPVEVQDVHEARWDVVGFGDEQEARQREALGRGIRGRPVGRAEQGDEQLIRRRLDLLDAGGIVIDSGTDAEG